MTILSRANEATYGISSARRAGKTTHMLNAVTDILNETRKKLKDTKAAGDKMAEALDHQADMMESDGIDMSGQRRLTQDWRKASE